MLFHCTLGSRIVEENFDKRNDPAYARMVIQRCRQGDVSLINTVDFYTEDGVIPEEVGTTLEEVVHYDRMKTLQDLRDTVNLYRQGKADPDFCELGNALIGLSHEDMVPEEFGSSRKEAENILITEAKTLLRRLRNGHDMTFWGEGLEHYLFSRTGLFRRIKADSLGMTARDHALLRSAAYTRALMALQGYRSKRFGPPSLLTFLRECKTHKFPPEDFDLTLAEFRRLQRDMKRFTREL